MGHEVLSGPVPPTKQVTRQQLDALKAKWPTFEDLESCDRIILCGAEYLQDWIRFIYTSWDKLKVKKCGWFHESIDYAKAKGIDYDLVKRYTTVQFLPNPDDAEAKKAKWLPIGVDTWMFQRFDTPGLKPIEIGFTGLMYQKRQVFLSRLIPFIGALEIRHGNIQLLGADEDQHLFRRQTEILAQNYRDMEILLNLPSMSNVLVMKVLEAAACGTLVVTPELPSKLLDLLAFETKHIIFYQESKPQELADVLRYFVNHDEEREKIAEAGMKEVMEKHTIKSRLEVILEDK